MKQLATLLALTVTLLCAAPPKGWAMLVPADAGRASVAAPSIDRAADLKVAQGALESKLVRTELQRMGLSDKEAQERLSKLSDADLHKLASRASALDHGGDGGLLIGLLIIAFLVLGIIYFAKRV